MRTGLGFYFFLFTFALFLPTGFARVGNTCGVDALYQICLYYKLPIQYEQVYAACKPSDEGNSMYDLFQAAQALGFSATGVRMSFDELLKLESPAVAFVNGNHFVAVLGREGDNVKVVDYPQPPNLLSQVEFEKTWKGEALVVTWTGNTAEPRRPDNGPKIQFEQTLQDFGVVRQGEMVSREFVFSNPGTQKLVIGDVRSSCGCTAILLSATEVDPGGAGTLQIELNTSGRSGRQTQVVSLLTNDLSNPQVTLTLSGLVKVPLYYAPKQVYFGKVRKSQKVERDIFLTDSGEQNLSIIAADTDSPFLSVTSELCEGNVPRDGLIRYRVRVGLSPEAMPVGSFDSRVIILTTLEDMGQIVVPVTGEIVGDISVQPTRLFFGLLKPGQVAEACVVVRNETGQPFRIVQIRNPIRMLQVHIPQLGEQRAEYELRAVLRATKSVGVFRDQIQLTTNDPNEGALGIPVFAWVWTPSPIPGRCESLIE